MTLILGIETSCDETAAAVYDSSAKKILSNFLKTLHRDSDTFVNLVTFLT